jgi:FlaA1/EpsC-like NDP-sugar epimerase
MLDFVLRRFSRMERYQRSLIWTIQTGIFVWSAITAVLLRFEFNIPREEVPHIVYGVPIILVVKTIVFRLRRLDRGWWNYVSVQDALHITVTNVLGSAVSTAAIIAIAPAGFPRSVFILDFLLCLLATLGIRIAVRMVYEAAAQARGMSGTKNALIYGAGAAGLALLRELRSNPSLGYRARGFVDDNPHKVGANIQGVPVLGQGEDITIIVHKYGIEEVLIALPSASASEIAEILDRCRHAGVRCKTIPSMVEMIEGRGLATQIRDVAVEDLLGRRPVNLSVDQIRYEVGGKVVMVTGAAGSIGSELCRQLARFRPRAIVGYDIAETALFHLEQEMQISFPGVVFHAEVGSIQNEHRLADVLDEYRPSILYHAAAYKHVPMMEKHVFEAVENNVFGTWTVARLAIKFGVDSFVMISTDKAVRPTSVMGATKHVAELVIRASKYAPTRFACVRFGNVLGSNGSVVPMFKKQIAARMPVTVTHPEMRRYFMTIPEACQLVLQASTMSRGGEVFVLDMGDPVKIVDLATNLILLSGLKPGEDIKIEFVGMRPGEKLYEELNSLEENTAATTHEKIKIFECSELLPQTIDMHIRDLRQICGARDTRGLLLKFKELIPDYNPSASLLKQVLPERPPVSATNQVAAGVS